MSDVHVIPIHGLANKPNPEVLRRVWLEPLAVPESRELQGFMTVGSPLDLDEIQDKLSWNGKNGFPPRLSGDWVNIFDPCDVVARPDRRLANDFRRGGKPTVIDIEEPNWGRWRHSATKYLKGTRLRQELRRLCDREI